MSDAVDEFFAGYPPDVQTISRTLRTVVQKALPDANEILYADQNHVGYSFTQSSRDRVVYICPLKDYVRLGFMFGANLPDPNHLLVGEGKRLRHIKVRTPQAAHDPALETLVKAAWEDALTHIKKKP